MLENWQIETIRCNLLFLCELYLGVKKGWRGNTLLNEEFWPANAEEVMELEHVMFQMESPGCDPV